MKINRRKAITVLTLAPFAPTFLCAGEEESTHVVVESSRNKPEDLRKGNKSFEVPPQHAHLFQFKGKNWMIRSHRSQLEVYLWKDAKLPVPDIDIFDDTYEAKFSYEIDEIDEKNGFKEISGVLPLIHCVGSTRFVHGKPIWEMEIIDNIPRTIEKLQQDKDLNLIVGPDDVFFVDPKKSISTNSLHAALDQIS